MSRSIPNRNAGQPCLALPLCSRLRGQQAQGCGKLLSTAPESTAWRRASPKGRLHGTRIHARGDMPAMTSCGTRTASPAWSKLTSARQFEGAWVSPLSPCQGPSVSLPVWCPCQHRHLSTQASQTQEHPPSLPGLWVLFLSLVLMRTNFRQQKYNEGPSRFLLSFIRPNAV